MIEFNCPECNKRISVKPELAGRSGKCPGCSQKIVVPGAATPKPPTSTAVTRPPQPSAAPVASPPATRRPDPALPTQQVYAHTTPHTAIQVNVQNSHSSNSLGISSLVLGILSFFVCWIPLIGFGLSGLGLLLGIAGITMSVIRKGTGIGYSIAGSAVNAISLLVGIIFITVFASAVASVDQTVKRLEAERNKAIPQASPSPATTPAIANAASSPDGTGATQTQPQPQKPLPPAEVWHPATQPLTLSEVQIQIVEITTGKVALKRKFGDDESQSQDELLTIRVRITNGSSTKKLDYRGWMSDFGSLSGITAKLTDEHDNKYKSVDFPASVLVKDANTQESIYPGKTNDDAIVFELPTDTAKILRLTLSGKGCGLDGEFKFEIPRSMIKSQ